MKAVITKLAFIGLPFLVAAAVAAPASASARPPVTGSVHSTGVAATVDTGASVVPATSPSQCPVGDLCFWVSAGYVGAMGEVADNNGSWTKFSQSQCAGGTWNDCASAIYNHGQYDNARVFRDNNGNGGGVCLPRGTMWDNLTSHYFDNGYNMNDAISSNDWITSACS